MKKRTLKRTLVLALSFVLLLSFIANHSLVFATVGEDAAAAAVPIDAQTNGTQDMTASTIVTNGEMTDETLATQTTTTTAYPNRHEYTPGLYDGGVYTLRNYATGEYLSVQNGSTSEFSPLTTTTSSFNQYARFKFDYLGAGLYRFAPISSPQYYVVLSWYDSGGTLELYSAYESWGEYKIQHVGNGLYRIYAKVTNFETVLCSGITGKATHNNFDDVAEYYWDNTLWNLVPYSPTVYNAYEKVEFRHELTGRYLNVWGEYTADGSLVYATKYHATENEQFQMHATETEGEYYFIPTHRTTMYLTATNNLSISTTQNLSTQSFLLELIELDDNGYPLYRISAMINGTRKYLNMGTQVPGRELEYYAVFGDDVSQFWLLETVGFDYHDVRTLEINQTYEKEFWNVDEKAVYVLKNTGLDYPIKYRITVTSLWADMMVGVYVDENLTTPAYCYVESNTTDQYVLNVVLEPDVNYYCCLYNEDGDLACYYICITPFIATFHSYYPFHDCVYSSFGWIKNMGYKRNDRIDITVEQARTFTNELGERDFNSDIFVYLAHGNLGCLGYDRGENGVDPFLSSELPNMEHCQLAVWAACFSAASNPLVTSVAQQSVNNGAITSLGWTTSINSWDAKDFLRVFFRQLSLGSDVMDAVHYAIANEESFENMFSFIGGLEILGDGYQVLHHVSTDEIDNELNEILNVNVTAFDKNDYTLIKENDSIGVKLYCRMVNGITTDDYYLEFYQHGKLVRVKKSDYTFPLSDVVDQTAHINNILINNANVSADNLHYSYIDGKWHLLEKRVIAHEGDTCECQHEVSYYDWTANSNDNAVR